MIYLYGLLENRAIPAEMFSDLTGVTGPVDVAPTPKGALMFGPHDGEEILPRRRNLLAHTRVLEAAAEIGSVLPMRFGMSAANVEEVAHLLHIRAAEVEAAFVRIRGQVELGVRVTFPREAALQTTLEGDAALSAERARLMGAPKGNHFAQAEFGRRLAERLDARRNLAQKALLARLAPHITTHRLRVPEEDVQILAADVLVARDRQADFAAALEEAAAGSDFAPGAEPAIRVIGPVPTFNFVHLSLSPQASEAA